MAKDITPYVGKYLRGRPSPEETWWQALYFKVNQAEGEISRGPWVGLDYQGRWSSSLVDAGTMNSALEEVEEISQSQFELLQRLAQFEEN